MAFVAKKLLPVLSELICSKKNHILTGCSNCLNNREYHSMCKVQQLKIVDKYYM